MAELADATDLKSVGVILVGSSPTPGTTSNRSTLLTIRQGKIVSANLKGRKLLVNSRLAQFIFYH